MIESPVFRTDGRRAYLHHYFIKAFKQFFPIDHDQCLCVRDILGTCLYVLTAFSFHIDDFRKVLVELRVGETAGIRTNVIRYLVTVAK